MNITRNTTMYIYAGIEVSKPHCILDTIDGHKAFIHIFDIGTFINDDINITKKLPSR